MPDEFQPYVGPRPFERTTVDQNRFFGRDEEASELLSRISAHSAVLFYSQSGAGKTSLINAKLTHMLEDAGFDVLPASMRDVPMEDSVLKNVPNVFVFNVLRSWHQDASTDVDLTRISIAEFLKRRRSLFAEEDRKQQVAIFDQFEEIFISHQERFADRVGFLEQIAAAVEEDRLLRVVFAMREDYIAELDPYEAWLPEQLRSRYRLERLSDDNAYLAITEPLEGTEYSFAEGVVEQLVQNLLTVPVETAKGVERVTGESVEPVQLQVVCKTLWDNCQKAWKTKPGEDKVITQAYAETFGDVDQALSTFYESAIGYAVEATGVKEGVLRRWFEKYLITSAGTRGTVFRGRKETGDIPNTAADALVDQHIIRKELRGGSRWYELTHDRFIAPIKASNERWFLDHSGGAATPKRLDARAEQWAHDGRQKKDLIEDEGELLEAERWMASPAAADVGYTDTLFALVQASRASINEKKIQSARRLKLLTAALVVVAVLLIITSIFAIRGWQSAVDNEEAATGRELEAYFLRGRADDLKREADSRSGELANRTIQLEVLNQMYKTEKIKAQAGERLAKRDRDERINLLFGAQDAETNYQFALGDTRDDCEMKAALMQSLAEYERLRAGFQILSDPKRQTKISKRIDDINNRLGSLKCP
jgi:hypothetical protein